MRIVVGSLQQESNTLCPAASRYEDFDIARGDAMLGRIAAARYFEQAGVEMLPTLYANAVPGGALRKEDFNRLAAELVDRIPQGGFDGIYLYLHGALYVEDIGSGEKALLAMIREKAGVEIPIALALDFHANNTDELMEMANIIVGYRTAPHRDMDETEIRAAKLLVRCVERRLLPRPQMSRAYVVSPGDCVITDQRPLCDILAEARRLEQAPGMLVCNVFNGQAWVDAPYMGPSMVCIHETDVKAAKAAADRLARMFYDARYDFKFEIEACPPDEAIRLAAQDQPRPVFVTDSGDNTTAGAPGDSAFMLRLLQDTGAQNVLLGGLTDALAVRACAEKNVGDTVQLIVGGTISGTPATQIKGTLLYKGDIEGWYGENAGPPWLYARMASM
jgi:microcystin degradation protein MlrC